MDRFAGICHEVYLEGERIRLWQTLAFNKLADRRPQASAATLRRTFPRFLMISPSDQQLW